MNNIELILGNSNKRFSGVTSTMLQVLPHQKTMMEIAILGEHHITDNTRILRYKDFIKLCRKTLPDGKFRIFHARRNDEMIQALIAQKFFGAKIKIVFTSTAQRNHSSFTRWLMSKMDAIITTCSAANSYLKQPADIIIPHGVDIESYRPREASTKDNETINIGVFGRIRPSKGIDLLIDAIIPLLKKYPNVILNICGETTSKFQSYYDQQVAKIEEAGLNEQVILHGKVDFSYLPELYRNMDLVCAMSRNEGFGLTPLEAMASGVAVLTSEAGGWKDFVKNGVNGYYVPIGDVQAIRRKLAKMINDPEKLRTMGKAGRDLVEQDYTNKKEAKELCSFFQSLI